ncbi:MAG: type II toxin-antitoxin system VapC family toxin [Planctomycetes bacterium]|nr:type II toxin-antitoxin system VapC family toxin [Planctomycetota bacterium]
MKLLVDTHTFLWFLTDAPSLSATAREAIASADNHVVISAASAWEVTVKYALGKLPLPDEPDRFLPAMRKRAGIELLPIGEAEVCQVHKLPPIHRDPFDRILVAQATVHGLVIVTDDATIGRYPVRTLW